MQSKIQKKRFLILGVFAMVWGCTEKKSFMDLQSQYQITFSEELSLDFGEVGMSSQVPFSISPLDRRNESFLIFNNIYRRLDTISFSKENKRLVPGIQIPKEGPGSIASFYNFTHTGNGVIFFSGNDIYYVKDGNTVRLNMPKELDTGNGSLKSIYGDGVNGVFQVLALNEGSLYLIINDNKSGEFSLIKYNFEIFEEINFSFDIDNMEKNKIIYNDGNMILSNGYPPYLSVYESVILVSYPFMTKISRTTLDDMEQFDFQYESYLFKTEKDMPVRNSNFNSMTDFFEIKSKWHNDVSYGVVYRLNDHLMYRMVFDTQQGSNKNFLELFDNSLQKLGEFDLTAIEPDLKKFHVTVEGKILIQSSKDPDEDIFKYYLISVDKI